MSQPLNCIATSEYVHDIQQMMSNITFKTQTENSKFEIVLVIPSESLSQGVACGDRFTLNILAMYSDGLRYECYSWPAHIPGSNTPNVAIFQRISSTIIDVIIWSMRNLQQLSTVWQTCLILWSRDESRFDIVLTKFACMFMEQALHGLIRYYGMRLMYQALVSGLSLPWIHSSQSQMP